MSRVSDTWISAAEFGHLIGISPQAARKRVRKAAKGQDADLIVRETIGRGGRSGIAYEISVRSLPEAIKKRFMDRLEPLPLFLDPNLPRLLPAKNQTQTIMKRDLILREAMLCDPRTEERAEALRRAHAVHGVPLRTLQNWIKRHDDHGGDMNALARKRPADAAQKRVGVTRAFDKAFIAAGFDAALLPELQERLIDCVTGAWAGTPSRSARTLVPLEASTAFQRLCIDRGYHLPDAAFKLSPRVFEPYRHYRDVDRRANDRKAFDDDKPRHRMDNSLWQPLQRVCMDVKPIDVVMLRPDGSRVYPKMIGLMDVGTHRLFPYIVMLNAGEGVRQEHVIEAFGAMCAHPDWGMPQTLQRDNGSEFLHLDKLRDVLALINEPGVCTITNAKPYSGASKPVESMFSIWDKFIFSQMTGYTGRDRMHDKIQRLGKEPDCYPGGIQAFIAEVEERAQDWAAWPIGSGPFKGRAPREIYRDHLVAGWRPIRISQASLDQAFCERIVRRVDRGAVTVAWRGNPAERYRHPQLPNGQEIEIALPYRRDGLPLFYIPEHQCWAQLEREMLYVPWEHDAAKDSGRAQRANNRRVTDLSRTAGKINLGENRQFRIAKQGALPALPRPHTVVTGDSLPDFASAKQEADERATDQRSEAERKKAREDRETTRLLEQQRRHKEQGRAA